MMHWANWLTQVKYHHRDLRCELARDRLAAQALAAQSRRVTLSGRALAWLGIGLVEWGSHLQERYGKVTLSPSVAQERT